MPISIRTITEADSEAFAALIIQLTRESPFTLLTEAEARAAAATQLERTRLIIASPNQRVLLATDQEQLVGFLALTQGVLTKNRHVCSLMMGVLAAHQRQGIGSALMKQGLAWAETRGVKRVELGVMASNDKALTLYRKFGFQHEGTRRAALLLEDTPADEQILARIL